MLLHYIKLTRPEKSSQEAVVTIMKTAKGFNQQVAGYRDICEEYEKLVGLVPKHKSVIPPRQIDDVL